METYIGGINPDSTGTDNTLLQEIVDNTSGSEGTDNDLLIEIRDSITNGGVNPLGNLYYTSIEDRGVAGCNLTTAGTIYGVIGIRLQSGSLASIVDLTGIRALCRTSDDVEWLIIVNPTVTGTFTYADYSTSDVQIAYGAQATPPTITGGQKITGGYVQDTAASYESSETLANRIKLSDTGGTADEIVICARTMGANAQMHLGVEWKQS
jgi:hypothetical protein